MGILLVTACSGEDLLFSGQPDLARETESPRRDLRNERAFVDCLQSCVDFNSVEVGNRGNCDKQKWHMGLAINCEVYCSSQKRYCPAGSGQCSFTKLCAKIQSSLGTSNIDFKLMANDNNCAASCSSIESLIGARGLACLSGDMVVKTPEKMKLVRDLEIGEMVHVGGGKFEPIVWALQHSMAGIRDNHLIHSPFVQIRLEHNQTIWLTPNHYVITTEGEKTAAEVKVGDVFLTGENVPVRTVVVQMVGKKGVYGPMTPSLKLEVNGVMVSALAEPTLPAWMVSPLFHALWALHSILPATVFAEFIDGLSSTFVEPVLEHNGAIWWFAVITAMGLGLVPFLYTK